jgi:hypothetical protein
MDYESYVYKSEVNWSILTEGFTLPVENQVIFARNMGNFLHRGESKNITLYLNGKSYGALIRNVNFNPKFMRKKDILQIRYTENGELAQALRSCFPKSYNYFKLQREKRSIADRSAIKLPEGYKEYLAIYTTQYEDSYILETIEAEDILILKHAVHDRSERIVEADLNYDVQDKNATILTDHRIVKIRKLNKKIGDNLKLLYGYRCQICGQLVGADYGAQIAETHHIDYFINSLNNDSNNQIVVCPNHHSIIHQVNPIFDKKTLLYLYQNGVQEGLKINLHLTAG